MIQAPWGSKPPATAMWAGAFLGFIYVFIRYFLPFCFLVLRDIVGFFCFVGSNFAAGVRQELEADRARRAAASQKD